MRNGKQLLLFFFAAISLLLFAGNKSQDAPHAEQLLSVAYQREDFTFFRSQLQKLHPNLYLYSSKEKLDAHFDSVYAQINRPATSLDFMACITSVYPLINDGHTFVLPHSADINYYNAQKKFLPLDLRWDNEKLVVVRNCTNDSIIRPGTEITAINGVPVALIMDTLFQNQVRDGLNIAYPDWILNRWFREYFSYSFGHPQNYSFSYRDRNGMTVKANCAALSKDSIRYYRIRNCGVTNPAPSSGMTLKLDSLNHNAVLTIGTFDNKILKQKFGQKFKVEITLAMKHLLESNCTHLVLDLRDNQGGDDANGKLLLSYLLAKPFELVHKGPASGTTSPQAKIFRGTIICLTNGGTFSVSGMVCSSLELHKRAQFVGEETGGNSTILSGSAGTFHLPHSKIYCEVSRKSWQLVDRPNTGRGVIPFYFHRLSPADIINNRDSQMELALKLVAQ